MSLSKIKKEALRLGTLVSAWEVQERVNDIERDLVLDLLRNLYEEVKFLREDQPQDLRTDSSATPETATITRPERVAEPIVTPKPEIPEPVATGTTPTETTTMEAQKEIKTAEETGCTNELQTEEHPATPEEPVAQQTEEESVAQQMEEVPPRPKRHTDRDLIRSLYDGLSEPRTAYSSCSIENDDHLIVPDPIIQTEVSLETEPAKPVQEAQPAPQAETAAPKTTVTPRPEPSAPQAAVTTERKITVEPERNTLQDRKTVLGDVIHAHGQTLGDSFQCPPKDIASKIAADETTLLRKAIGINDKFLMIRDLFNGNADTFEETIAALDQFSDLDEALLYLHENFEWNPNSDGAKRLMELLVRKLS